jgi:hypothetical protein
VGSFRRGTRRVTLRSPTICVDTGVLTSSLRVGSPLEERYRPHLTGRRLVIATQVVAEARFGALRAGWGTRRTEALERLLRSAYVLAPDDLTARRSPASPEDPQRRSVDSRDRCTTRPPARIRRRRVRRLPRTRSCSRSRLRVDAKAQPRSHMMSTVTAHQHILTTRPLRPVARSKDAAI